MKETQKRLETIYKLELLDEIKELGSYLFPLLLQDIRKVGTPDLTTNGRKKTCWWEVKHAVPECNYKGIQTRVCERLAAKSFCRYIVYWQDGKDETTKRTLIVHPREIRARMGWFLVAEEAARGFNHSFVVDYMRRVHEGRVK